MNLFSVFDPVSYFGQINWSITLFLLLMFFNLNLVSSINGIFIKTIIKEMVMFFLALGFPNGRVMSLFMVILFIYIMVENVIGLFPFIFTATAHPVITMGLGLVGWMMCFSMGWLKNFTESAAHLVPLGSPLGLSFLLVIVESISHLIRPFTLSIRLCANMMAGHLIIGLISSVSKISLMSGMLSIFAQSILLVLESGVAIVQGLVFSILLLLYVLEYY